jgi:hypothetical protein
VALLQQQQQQEQQAGITTQQQLMCQPSLVRLVVLQALALALTPQQQQ